MPANNLLAPTTVHKEINHKHPIHYMVFINLTNFRKIISVDVSQIYLLSYYLANKQSLHVRSQGLEIPTLIGEK